jgi:hypothetical protein
MKKADTVRYSSIIQDFIRPLLNQQDNDELFFKKIKIAEVIWNYCIAKEFNLSVFAELDKHIAEQNKKHKEMKCIFDAFVESKNTDFKCYKNFITKVEYRINANGNKSLYVESIDPEFFKKS